MSQITVSHLTFAYDGACDNVFEDVSFVLDTDWRLGFTGRNGRGKTTFLKLLDGTLESRGAVRAGVPVLYFPFPVEYPEDDTQAVLERLLPDCPAWRILRELNLLGVEQDVLYRPFYTMSNGEQTKILLASLFLHDGAFLLIDEPTNHLDAGGRRLLGEYLAQKRGYILVSHDRDLLDRCADHMLVLNRRDITVMQGNFTAWEENKRLQDERERAENERLEKDIARLGEAARRTERWSGRAEREKHARNSGLRPDRGFLGHKAAKLMQRSKSIQRRQSHRSAPAGGHRREKNTAAQCGRGRRPEAAPAGLEQKRAAGARRRPEPFLRRAHGVRRPDVHASPRRAHGCHRPQRLR